MKDSLSIGLYGDRASSLEDDLDPIAGREIDQLFDVQLTSQVRKPFDAIFFDEDRWYEIDTRADVREAENLFARVRNVASRSLIVPNPTPTNA